MSQGAVDLQLADAVLELDLSLVQIAQAVLEGALLLRGHPRDILPVHLPGVRPVRTLTHFDRELLALAGATDLDLHFVADLRAADLLGQLLGTAHDRRVEADDHVSVLEAGLRRRGVLDDAAHQRAALVRARVLLDVHAEEAVLLIVVARRRAGDRDRPAVSDAPDLDGLGGRRLLRDREEEAESEAQAAADGGQHGERSGAIPFDEAHEPGLLA